MKISQVIIATVILHFSVTVQAQQWNKVLQLDESGKVIFGSKSQLISAIRSGQDVKIAWGWKTEDKSIEHISIPTWTAILNEKEVLFHIDSQVFGAISWDDAAGTFEGANLEDEWRVIIDTNGTFDAVWYNRKNHEITRRMPQQHNMSWFVLGEVPDQAPAFFEK